MAGGLDMGLSVAADRDFFRRVDGVHGWEQRKKGGMEGILAYYVLLAASGFQYMEQRDGATDRMMIFSGNDLRWN